MCGIIAEFDSQAPISLQAVQTGLAALRHRGPDSLNTWLSSRRQVALGHARLSIIDITTGQQPVSNETQTVKAIVNGEFYDFELIRTQLEARGHQFHSRSDSEILVHLYEEFGTDSLRHLRGEFAFVLWDETLQLLFAARDRFGIKPLFYTRRNERLLIASEVKALHAAGHPAAWDEQGFFERVTLNASLPGRTLFAGVNEVPPGHYIKAVGSTFSLQSYWDFDYPVTGSDPSPLSDDECAEQFLRLLDNAVRTRLRADVRVGCYLSGGIDSASILALMSRYLNQPVPVFSVCFDVASYDESTLARQEAERVGASFTPVPVTQELLAADFSTAIWHGESFFGNTHGVAKFALSRAAQQAGITVVLTGEGADEILGGYPCFVKDAIRHSDPTEATNLRQALNLSSQHFDSLLRVDLPFPLDALRERLGYVPAWIESREWFLQSLRPVLPASFQSETIYRRLFDDLNVAGQMTSRAVLNQSLYFYNKTALPNYILTLLGDRMELAHSVEGRQPFLDHHLVEFVNQLPPEQKVRGSIEKFILRKAMRTVLPPALCGRRKKPFQAPPPLFRRKGRFQQLFQDTLRGSGLDRVPFLNKTAVLQLLEAETSNDEALMTLLSACVLAERFHL